MSECSGGLDRLAVRCIAWVEVAYEAWAQRLKEFFFPPAGSPAGCVILPYAILGAADAGLGRRGRLRLGLQQLSEILRHRPVIPCRRRMLPTCASPHANVTCEECHIGRGFITESAGAEGPGHQGNLRHHFNLYEFPIRASPAPGARDLRKVSSARSICQTTACVHIVHFADDTDNTASTTYLILKTGGGAKREGLGRGIHWHIVNKVEYYATDELSPGHSVCARPQ